MTQYCPDEVELSGCNEGGCVHKFHLETRIIGLSKIKESINPNFFFQNFDYFFSAFIPEIKNFFCLGN